MCFSNSQRRVRKVNRAGRADGAFTLIELIVVVACVAGLLALLSLMGDRQRRTAMLGEDLSNMRQIAALTGQYAADNDDKFWTFSWQGGVEYNSRYSELNLASTDIAAAANQAIVILRDHAGRLDMPKMNSWYSYLMYSHLPLLQYAGLEFPNRLFVSGGDRARQLWASDPLGYDQNKFKPNQQTPSDIGKRWPYSLSYQLASSFFEQAQDPSLRINQTGEYEPQWNAPEGSDLHARTLSSTAFPSQKVHLHDKYAWHFGTTVEDMSPNIPLVKGHPYFAEAHARLPLLFVDGHAAVHQSGVSNPGWMPTQPTNCDLTTTFASPSSGKTVPGRYRWTRSYLEGRDVGGPEVGDCLK